MMNERKKKEPISGQIGNIGIVPFENFAEITEKDRFPKGGVNTVNFLLIMEGALTCSVRKKESVYQKNDIFIIHPFESWEVEIIQPVTGYSVAIDRDSLMEITLENKKLNETLHLSDAGAEKLNELLSKVSTEYQRYNIYQERGFINNFIGILSEENLFRIGSAEADSLFDNVKNYIEEHYNEDLSLSNLAQHFGYNAKYFSSAFHKYFGVKLRTYINHTRVKKALELEKKIGGCYTINEVIFCSGFNSRETYYRALRKYKQEMESVQPFFEKKHSVIRKKTAVLVGYGNRGQVYGDYALGAPNELEIIGVVEPNAFKLKIAAEKYGLTEKQLFTTWSDFLKAEIKCDLVINTTMDSLHYSTAIEILSAGYDMLIEKPIVNNAKELLRIQELAKKKKRKVFVGHVLRYTPYYRAIKSLINNGEIGEIMTMEMSEHVCTPHYLTSFDRGKWNSEEECGSALLLTKSCHDMDLMCWLNNASVPQKVVSLGSRSQFVREKMPDYATEFCIDCPKERECQYSAIRQYIDLNVMPFLVWDSFDKPYEEISNEEKIQFLKENNYGRCAYIAGQDLIDRQGVMVTFKNGSCCTFMLVGGSLKAERDIRIVGTTGEIEGKLSEDKFILRRYNKDYFDGVEQVIDLKDSVTQSEISGHNGGDFAILHDIIAYLNGEDSLSITNLEDSIYGHLCVFAAEQSRKEDSVVQIKEIETKKEKKK